MDNNNGMNPMTGMPEQQPIVPGMDMTQMPQQEPVAPAMDMNQMPGQQPIAPGMAPQQPQMDMMGQQPVAPGMAPQQPQMDMMGQQPVAPGMAPQQPQMDMMGQQPVAPGMGMQQGMMPGMQPGMMPGMQPGMMPQQPMQPMAPNGKMPKAKKPKKPLTKGQKTGIIIGSIVAVAAIVCGVIFIPKFFKSDREKVLDAYEATFDAYAENGGTLAKKVDMEAIEKAFVEKGGESTANVSFEIGDESYSLSYNQNTSVVIDQKNKQLSGSVEMGLGDSTLLETAIYADTDNTYIELPELIDGYIVFPNKDFMGKIFNSPWAQELGVQDELDVASIPSFDITYFTGDNAMESNEIYSGYVSAIEQVWDKAEFKKQGKAKIDVNGQTVTAKEYYVTLKKDDIISAISSALDGAEEAIASNEAMLDEMDMSISDFQYGMQQIKTLLPSFVNKDLVIKVYIKDKKVIKTVCKDDINIMGAKLGYDFWMDTADNDFILNMGFSAMDETAGLKIEAHDLKGNTNGKVGVFAGSESYDITFDETKTTSGTVETTVLNIKAADFLTADATYNYDSSNDTFNGTVDVNAVGDATAQVTFKGKYENIQKGVSYAVNIEEMKFKVMNQDFFTMTTYAGIDTSKTTAQPIDGGKKKYDLSAMTESELESVITDNEAKIEEWLERIANEPVIQDLVSLFESQEVYEEEDDDIDWDIDDVPEESLDDASISVGDVVYKVLGTINGFDFYGSYGASIEFDTDSYSSISYSLVEADSAEAALEQVFEGSDTEAVEMSESAYGQETEVDGASVLYSAESYTFYDMGITTVTAVTEVSSGVYMTVVAYVYTDDDNYSIDDILQAISPQYYELAE